MNRQQDTFSEAGIGLNKVRRVCSVGVATERNTLDWLFNLQPNYQKGTRCSRDAECLGTTPPPHQIQTPQMKTLSRLGNANSRSIFQTRVYGSLRRERILVQSIPAAEKPRSASTDVGGGGLTANRRHDHAHRCTRKLLSRFYGSTHRLVICAITQHFNCFLILHAFLCSTVTRNLKPSNPGFFCPHTNPGLTSLKTFETLLPGFSGTRVAFPIRDKRAVSLS